MNDFRGMINDRYYYTTFIVGPQYVSVAHINRTLEEIFHAIEEHLGELKKPFVIGFQSFIPAETFYYLVENELCDIVLE